jgi:hypothetical protein
MPNMKSLALAYAHQQPPLFIQLCRFNFLYWPKSSGGRFYIINFLYSKKFGLNQIVEELASVHEEQVCSKKAVKYWIYHVKLGRTDMKDRAKPDRLQLDDIDARIL